MAPNTNRRLGRMALRRFASGTLLGWSRVTAHGIPSNHRALTDPQPTDFAYDAIPHPRTIVINADLA